MVDVLVKDELIQSVSVKDELIKKAEAFDLDIVTKRYAKEQELPYAVAKEHEREAKRFLVLCALAEDGTYGMRGPIDEYWHNFITFTQLYVNFCNAIANRYLHHVPNTEDPEAPKYSLKGMPEKKETDGLDLREGYVKLLRDYEITFSEQAPVHLWPRPTAEYEAFAGAGGPCSCGCRCIAKFD